RRDQLDFVVLILQLIALQTRISPKQFRAPFADDALCRFLAAAKTEAAYESRIVIVYGSQCDEGILWIELFDFPQLLSSCICFRNLVQRLAQKILDSGFAVELIEIAVI